jgi:organic radical activating enzyme
MTAAGDIPTIPDDRSERSIALAAMRDGSPEIFTSIQGEGPRLGMLSLFVRLSECNLFCRWCDTAYTWRWTDKHEHEDDKVYDRRQWQVRMTANELVDEITRRRRHRVIFTGGEPLVQHRMLFDVLRALRDISDSYEFEFETNGTIAPPPEFIALCSLLVVSPKLANASMERSITIRPALRTLLESPKSVLKLVAESNADFAEIRALQEQFDIPSRRIWIMPRARSADDVARVGRAIIDRVIEGGYNYSTRLHLELFGEKQGT